METSGGRGISQVWTMNRVRVEDARRCSMMLVAVIMVPCIWKLEPRMAPKSRSASRAG
jgi:hypothetical protein